MKILLIVATTALLFSTSSYATDMVFCAEKGEEQVILILERVKDVNGVTTHFAGTVIPGVADNKDLLKKELTVSSQDQKTSQTLASKNKDIVLTLYAPNFTEAKNYVTTGTLKIKNNYKNYFSAVDCQSID